MDKFDKAFGLNKNQSDMKNTSTITRTISEQVFQGTNSKLVENKRLNYGELKDSIDFNQSGISKKPLGLNNNFNFKSPMTRSKSHLSFTAPGTSLANRPINSSKKYYDMGQSRTQFLIRKSPISKLNFQSSDQSN